MSQNLKFYYLDKFTEKKQTTDLFYVSTFFEKKKIKNFDGINKIILQTSFESINFNKKRITPFLLLLELLFQQRNVVKSTNKTIFSLKSNKNLMVGCKLTLRKKLIETFFDDFLLNLSYQNQKFLFLNQKLNENNGFSITCNLNNINN